MGQETIMLKKVEMVNSKRSPAEICRGYKDLVTYGEEGVMISVQLCRSGALHPLMVETIGNHIHSNTDNW